MEGGGSQDEDEIHAFEADSFEPDGEEVPASSLAEVEEVSAPRQPDHRTTDAAPAARAGAEPPAGELDDIADVAGEVGELKDALAAQMLQITREVARVQQELMQIKTDAFAQMDGVQELTSAAVGELGDRRAAAGAAAAPQPRSKVVRFASDTHLSGGGHTRRRPTGFRPDDDGFDNPLGGRLLTAQQRASGRRSRPAPRRAADGTSWVTSTAIAVFLVIILSNVLPRALEMLYDARTEAAFEAEDREEW